MPNNSIFFFMTKASRAPYKLQHAFGCLCETGRKWQVKAIVPFDTWTWKRIAFTHYAVHIDLKQTSNHCSHIDYRSVLWTSPGYKSSFHSQLNIHCSKTKIKWRNIPIVCTGLICKDRSMLPWIEDLHRFVSSVFKTGDQSWQ